MEFNSLIRRVADFYKVDAAGIEPDATLKANGAAPAPQSAGSAAAPSPGQGELCAAAPPAPPARSGESRSAAAPGGHDPAGARRGARARRRATANRPLALRDRAHAGPSSTPGSRAPSMLGVVAIDAETTSLDPMQAELCGFSLALRRRRGLLRAAFAPPGRPRPTACSPAIWCPVQIPESAALAALKPLLEDRRRPQGRPEPEIRLAGARAARHRDGAATTTPC